MDEMQQIINDLEEENKKLKEKNDELKGQLVEKTDDYNIIVYYNTEHKKQVVKLEEENKELKEENEKLDTEKWKCVYQNIKLNTENKKIKKREEEDIREQKKQLDGLEQTIDEELIKLRNDNEIVKMMLIDEYVRTEIEDTIDEGINQYTFRIGTGFYREHKLKYVKDIIMPHLTTYNNGDSQFSSYKNGMFYYKMDCYNEYRIETNDDGTYSFDLVESDEEDSDDE